jgi:hypothetical protein
MLSTFMSEVFKGDSATEFETMSILTNDSRRLKVDDFNDDFLVTMKKIEALQHSMSQSQSMLATQQTRNAELEELEILQPTIRSRQSPISAALKSGVEQSMNTLIANLFPIQMKKSQHLNS